MLGDDSNETEHANLAIGLAGATVKALAKVFLGPFADIAEELSDVLSATANDAIAA
jgi:hypothetical protein